MISFLGRGAAAISFLIIVLISAFAGAVEGKVVSVTDGDTLIVLTPEKQQVRVRLAEIDTPESGQPYGQKAKTALSSLVFGKEARVEVQDQDRYGRQVGRVYVGTTDVNAEMIRLGAAWVYRQYNKDKSLLPLEEEARQAKLGLWALPEVERMPPWEWRAAERLHAHTEIKATASEQETNGGTKPESTCGGKTKCGQMTSCAEARFYLEECGLNRLDGDKDGVPCEALCR